MTRHYRIYRDSLAPRGQRYVIVSTYENGSCTLRAPLARYPSRSKAMVAASLLAGWSGTVGHGGEYRELQS
jgi:hypothetical protein